MVVRIVPETIEREELGLFGSINYVNSLSPSQLSDTRYDLDADVTRYEWVNDERLVYSVAHFLDAVTRPILRPFQRFIPPLGGVDITPIIAIIVIQALRSALLPWIFGPIIGALGG